MSLKFVICILIPLLMTASLLAESNAKIFHPRSTLIRTNQIGKTSELLKNERHPKLRGNIESYGGICDGVVDDRAALVRAIRDVERAGGGTVVLPNRDCRILQTQSARWTTVGNNVAVRGAGPNSRLLLACTKADGYNELLRISGKNVAIENVGLVRATKCAGVMIRIQSSSNLRLRGLKIDGRASKIPGAFHGIAVAESGRIEDATLAASTITDVGFGLFQSNKSTARLNGFLVDNSTFRGNWADDLEFNSPNGLMKNIRVERTRFEKNRAVSYGAGFAILGECQGRRTTQ